jgi:Zn-finger nucleic acid-binding protein
MIFYQGNKTVKKETLIRCVTCDDTDMVAVKCGPDLEINQCRVCGGIWLDRDELEKLQSLGGFYLKNIDKENQTVIQSGKARLCPRCNLNLENMPHPVKKNIMIDRCIKCGGLWLDSGELLKISKV